MFSPVKRDKLSRRMFMQRLGQRIDLGLGKLRIEITTRNPDDILVFAKALRQQFAVCASLRGAIGMQLVDPGMVYAEITGE